MGARQQPNYTLLASEASGLHLSSSAGANAGLSLREHCDDSAVWQWTAPDAELKNAATGAVIAVEPSGAAPPGPGSSEAAEIDALFGASASLLVPQTYRLLHAEAGLGGELVFAARDAPERLPSVHLHELETQGWTVVDKVMSQSMVDNLVA